MTIAHTPIRMPLSRTVTARVRAAIESGARRRRIARTVRALERLDDRSLSDIGVRRQDIRSHARAIEDAGAA